MFASEAKIRQRTFIVRVGPAEVFDLVAALPDIKAGRFVLVGGGERFGVRPTKTRAPYATYALVTTALQGRVSAHRLGAKVAVRCQHRIVWRGVAVAGATAVPNFGGNLIADVLELPDSVRRLQQQRRDLIALVAQALVPVQVGPTEGGPYRVW